MADPILLPVLARRTVRAAKKLIAAVGRHVLDGGEVPDELRDLDLAMRFGWTLKELDEQDMARVMPAVAAQNVRDSLRRLNVFLETLGKVQPSKADMEIYSWVKELMDDG